MADILVPSYRDARQVIMEGFEKGGDKLLLVFHDKNEVEQKRTFRQVQSNVMNLTAYMRSLGLDGHQKIAILSENSYEWQIAFFSIIVGGNVIIPMDSKLSTPELAHQLKDCACTAVIYSEHYKEAIQEMKAEHGVSLTHAFNTDCFEEYYSKGAALPQSVFDEVKNVTVNPEDLLTIVYTSGTTGKTKGVMLSHKNVASDITATCRINSGGHAICFLPFNHTFSWTTCLFAGFVFSEWGYICNNLMHIYKDIKNYNPTNFAGVPLIVKIIYENIISTAKRKGKYETMMNGLQTVKNFRAAGMDIRRESFTDIHESLGGNLEFIMCGGAHLDPVIEDFMDNIGIDIITGYGLTECAPCVTCTKRGYANPGSVGQVLECCEVKIHEPDENGIGEIYVRGDNVMMGYYNDPEETAKAFDGEWLKTGDLGYMDYEGFLFFTGRKKNLIVLSNGKNVSPEEIEDELSRIDYIKECIAYGENDRIVAEVFLNEEEYPDCRATIENDIDRVCEVLAEFKRPTVVKIRDTEFDKTTSLKIKRKYK